VDNGFNIADLAVRLDGTRFATSNSKGEVMMWDLKTGRKLWTYALKTNGAAVPIAFNLDGTLLAAGACNTTSSCTANSDSTVVVLNTADGSVAGSLTLAGETVQALAFTPLGDGIVVGSRARLSIFSTADITAQNNRQRTARAIIPFTDATSIAFSGNLDRMIVGGSDMLRMYAAK
jgi:WD40 repeat protein